MTDQQKYDQEPNEDKESEEKEVKKCHICSRRHRTPTPMCPRGPA
jgi:hypothetical protein